MLQLKIKGKTFKIDHCCTHHLVRSVYNYRIADLKISGGNLSDCMKINIQEGDYEITIEVKEKSLEVEERKFLIFHL